MMPCVPQDQLAPPRGRDRGCAYTGERPRAARILRRDLGLHRQPRDAVLALRHGRPIRQTPRERCRSKIRRSVMYVQPRARGTLLPLSLPEASILRGHTELRGDWDLGCCDGRHWEFAGNGDDQGHRRATRQVFWTARKKKKEVNTGFWGWSFLFSLGQLADERPSLLIYAALGIPPFRSIKLRKRRATCPACGTEGEKVGKIEEIDYVQFCGGPRPDWETLGLNPSSNTASRITANVGFVSPGSVWPTLDLS